MHHTRRTEAAGAACSLLQGYRGRGDESVGRVVAAAVQLYERCRGAARSRPGRDTGHSLQCARSVSQLFQFILIFNICTYICTKKGTNP